MSKKRIEHNKKVILTYLKESGALHSIDNTCHAQKAFIINSVLHWVLNKVDTGEYSAGDVSFYLDSMNDFLDGKLRVYWSGEGNLVIGM